MSLEHSAERYKPVDVREPVTTTLLPSNQEMQAFYRSGASSKTADPKFIDFGNSDDIYGRNEVVALRLEITSEIAPYMRRPSDNDLRDYCANPFDAPRITKPFVDSGAVLNPNDPTSWTFPTRENYTGWLPGDPINPFTFTDDASKYIQEIMKQNFTVNADGKRVSLNDESIDKNFRYRFGNAARHAIGIGDLIFKEGMSADVAQGAMSIHEPESWVSGTAQSILKLSAKPLNESMADSTVDMANNAYAADRASRYKDFNSFAQQMLSDSWNSATKGTGKVGVPLGTK